VIARGFISWRHRDRSEVLVFERKHIPSRPFVSGRGALSVHESADRTAGWVERREAERLRGWVQPIPCAIMRQGSDAYLVLRRVSQQRKDLSSRVTLLVGGHVDYLEGERHFDELLLLTLRRELGEEIGLHGLSEVAVLVSSQTRVRSVHRGILRSSMRSQPKLELVRRLPRSSRQGPHSLGTSCH